MKTWLFYGPARNPATAGERLMGIASDKWVQAALSLPRTQVVENDDGSIDILYLYGRFEPLCEDDDEPASGD